MQGGGRENYQDQCFAGRIGHNCLGNRINTVWRGDRKFCPGIRISDVWGGGRENCLGIRINAV